MLGSFKRLFSLNIVALTSFRLVELRTWGGGKPRQPQELHEST